MGRGKEVPFEELVSLSQENTGLIVSEEFFDCRDTRVYKCKDTTTESSVSSDSEIDMFECSEPRCIKSFRTFSELESHLEIFLTSHIDFFFIFGQCGDNYELSLFLKRKVGVTEHSRSLKPIKAFATVTCPMIVHFSTKRARSIHDVAREFACAVRPVYTGDFSRGNSMQFLSC